MQQLINATWSTSCTIEYHLLLSIHFMQNPFFLQKKTFFTNSPVHFILCKSLAFIMVESECRGVCEPELDIS